MSNVSKMFVSSTVGGVVVAALAALEGFPPERVVAAGIVGFAVVMGLLVILRWRP